MSDVPPDGVDVVLAGHDPIDETSSARPVPDYTRALTRVKPERQARHPRALLEPIRRPERRARRRFDHNARIADVTAGRYC